MNIIRFLVLVCAFWNVFPARAQLGGNATYRFLSLPVSASQMALGGKQFTSQAYDILIDFQQPALIDSTQLLMPAINYSNFLADVNYAHLGYVWQTPYGYFFSGIHYLNYGSFLRTDENGEKTGKFSANEGAVTFGYAYRLGKFFRIGANLKYVFSQLAEYKSSGLGGDFGILFSNRSGSELSLVLRNFGFQISTYNGTRESFPFEVDFSYAQLLSHAPLRLFLTLENLQKPRIAFANTAYDQVDPNGNVIHENITWVHHFFRHVVIGTEIFPRKRFRLRLGFNFRRAAELGFKDINFSSGMSYGFGIRLNKFALDYGYGQYHYASNGHFFTLHLFLNGKNE